MTATIMVEVPIGMVDVSRRLGEIASSCLWLSMRDFTSDVRNGGHGAVFVLNVLSSRRSSRHSNRQRGIDDVIGALKRGRSSYWVTTALRLGFTLSCVIRKAAVPLSVQPHWT